ncbi:D-alanyl-D-alanine carboxypeptidase [uncultured Caudovirales phage]|uniref:D-alanyl-D-alanine carboxypeptidase n=1 Tax=uncultured Caudovirales phage TaxID=2100421 RepID=A0A6J5N9D5_9CAUD|nr:D-alanyl-D-alanine carboxypeptidase [uncultured Caudovirales phage]
MSLSSRCELRLAGVHPDLVRVVRNLAAGGAVFRVEEGLRTVERQRHLVASGASQTMASRHITGHAVDLLPLVDGQPTFDWKFYYPMADAFRAATIAEKVPVVWGGAWGRLMTDYSASKTQPSPSKNGQDAYIARMRAQGVRPFLDGPHFELARAFYP